MVKTTLIILGLILLLGSLLRFYKQAELGTFRADQAIELSGARDILQGDLSLIGIKTSNSEVRNGAVMYYLLAPFVWAFQGDPMAGGTLQSLMSLGTIAIVFFIVRKNLGQKEALIAAFLTATSSLLVIYSRQTLLAFYPLFWCSLVFLVCTLILKRYGPLLVVLLGFLLGLTVQVHYSALGLILAATLMQPLFRGRKNFLAYYIFLGLGFLIGFSPMLAFEFRNEFFNTKMALDLVEKSTGPTFYGPLTNMLIFWQDSLSRFLFGGNILLTRIYLLALAVSLILFRKRLGLVQKLSLLFITCSLIFTFIFAKDLRPPFEYISHYAVVSFVPLIILTSWLLGKLPSILIFVLLGAYLILNIPAYNLQSNHGFSHSPGWGTLGIKKAVNIIKSDLSNRAYNVAMLVDAENQGIPLRYFLDVSPNKPLPIENYAGAEDLYVIAEPRISPMKSNLWEITSFGNVESEKVWNIQNGYKLYKLSKPKIEKGPSLVTLIYPVRARSFWQTKSLDHLTNIFGELSKRKFNSTWLLQYDALMDKVLQAKIKSDCPKCEFGLFLEVSENLATDSNVSYTIGEGHWYRPDKIFLSGYSLSDRVSLIDRQFEQFKKEFGYYPKSVGVWYLDPFSQNYIAQKYGVTSVVSVADQYDTDGQRYWGRPWGTPYYSQKYNTQAPANILENKSDVVQLQWAQRHPTDAFGVGPQFSQFSLQANDYINNKKDTEYFKNLLGMYLFNPENPFGQATIGLEVGQELLAFYPEHINQLDHLASLKNTRVVTQSEFTDWYKKTYPALSPVTQVSDGQTTWINSPTKRTSQLDIRNYDCVIVSKDILEKDKDTFIDREVGKNCDDTRNLDLLIKLKLLSENLKKPLSVFKWSTISGSRIVGVQTGKEEIFGFWQGKGIGSYNFPFQTLSKFKSLSGI